MTPTSPIGPALPAPQLVAQHLGALHPVEQLLTVLLAFGPFVLLGLVIVVRRRQDARETDAPDGAGDPEAPEVPAQRER